jgi:hypothetical protein
MDLNRATWRKARYSSGNGGNCVEVATDGREFAVRDSKDPDGPVLQFAREQWSEFAGRMRQPRLSGPSVAARATAWVPVSVAGRRLARSVR